MYETGDKVVCIDDAFAPWVYDLYTALPVKGRTYTVRDAEFARSDPKFDITEDAEIKLKSANFDFLVRLEELKNPDDPHSNVKQELGFKASRFCTPEEYEERVAAEAEQEVPT